MRSLVLLAGIAGCGLLAAAGDSPLRLDGRPVQGALLMGRAPAGSEVLADGERIMTSADGDFLIAFAREQTDPVELRVTTPDGDVHERTLRPVERAFDIQHIDGLDEDRVTPPPEVLERIREEAEQVRQARERRAARTDWLGGFTWPLTGPVTGVYGSQRVLNGKPRNPHWGIDIAAAEGEPVRAPAPGRITLAHPDMYFSGGTVLLDHGHGLVSAFLHLSEITIEDGERLERGDLIGRVGATGRATGPHLDWRMNLGEVRVDPALLLDWEENPDAEN